MFPRVKEREICVVRTFTKHRHNLAKWLSLDELRYRPAVFTSTCTRPKPLHIRALPPITSRYSLTEANFAKKKKT
ncbi:hypothetical protein T4D_16916 [Trichinella pseudospiralis]|uniref:Uncharacterized protein n=1 Tax=Trichinella pseudospiralis TaxID=6337 RepID=A0A0V1FLI7_TRIPS|nr:hypothetical protein T4D_16916 [Trichinella pseudospiralis]